MYWGEHARLYIVQLLIQLFYVWFHQQLKSKNADGHTPFMEAISQHNYYAALQILQFVEEHDEEQLTPYAGTLGQSTLLPPLASCLANLPRPAQDTVLF